MKDQTRTSGNVSHDLNFGHEYTANPASDEERILPLDPLQPGNRDCVGSRAGAVGYSSTDRCICSVSSKRTGSPDSSDVRWLGQAT
jgi:hypothetical protein